MLPAHQKNTISKKEKFTQMVQPSTVNQTPSRSQEPEEAHGLSWRERLASREMIPFAAIMILALLLRLLYLGFKSFDGDEIFSASMAQGPLLDFLRYVRHGEGNMILYYAILRFWACLGQSEFAVRSLSVVFGVATVPALYLVGARAFGRCVGTLAALLLAINGFHIEYSQDARAYTLLVFLVTLSSLFFIKSVRHGSRRNWIFYIVTSALAIYAHMFAVFVLAAHWVFVLLLPRKLAPWRKFIQSTVAIAFLALPMELTVLLENKGQLAWVPRTTALSVYSLFSGMAGGSISLSGYGSTALLLFVYLIPVIISVVVLVRLRPWSIENTEMWHLVFFLTWLLVPIILVLAISMRKPIFVDRFLIISLPPFILLAAHGISRVRGHWLALTLLCAIGGLTALVLFDYYKTPGEDWRGVTQYILSSRKPEDAIVTYPDFLRDCADYYFDKEAARHNLVSLAPDSSRVWFIGYNFTGYDYDMFTAIAEDTRAREASLAVEFPGSRKEKQFGELTVTLYQK